MEMNPISSQLGPVGPLLAQLHSFIDTKTILPEGVSKAEIKKLVKDVEKTCSFAMDLLEVENPSFTARCWTKNVRELFFDIADHLDMAMHGSRITQAKEISKFRARLKHALLAAAAKNPNKPVVNVKWVCSLSYGDIQKSIAIQEETQRNIEKHDEVADDQPKESRICHSSVSSPHTQTPETSKSGSKLAIKLVMDSLLTKLTVLMGEEYSELICTIASKEIIMTLKNELESMNALLEKLEDVAELNMQTDYWRNQMRQMAYDIDGYIVDIMLQFNQGEQPKKQQDVIQDFILQIRSLKGKEDIGNSGLVTEGVENLSSISYSDLPSHMKPCLVYLSVFPANSEIRKDRLIWRWIAEGLIPREGKEISLWEMGEMYFEHLLGRKLIEPVYDDERDERPLGCKVPGVVLDFITSLSKGVYFVTRDAKSIHMKHDFPIWGLNVCFSSQEECDAFTTATMHLSKVRSLTISVSGDVHFKSWMPFLSGFRLLRVLDLEEAEILSSENLEGIGKLILLRYLGLGGTDIFYLPEEIGELQDLETLDLRRTGNLKTLPASIVRLRKLVRLLLNGHVEAPKFGMQALEELSGISADGSISSLMSVAELLRTSLRMRMLGVRWNYRRYWRYSGEYRRSLELFFVAVRRSNIWSLILDGYPWDDFLDLPLQHDPPHQLQRFELKISGVITRDRYRVGYLRNLTHLCIVIGDAELKILRVLGMLPRLVHLHLYSLVTSPRRCPITISGDGFRCLVVFVYTSLGGMGLQFETGAMPQLRRLRIHFGVQGTKSLYGNFDFGLENLARVERVHATIHCRDASVSEVEDAEDAIREQVSNNSNSPQLQFDKYSSLFVVSSVPLR